MSLYSGKRIHGYKWKELPIDEHVIQRVEQLDENEKQPVMHRGMPCFEWAPGIEIEDIDDEEERALTIANGFNEYDAPEQLVLDMELEHNEENAPALYEDQEIMPVNDELAEEVIPVPNNDDGLIIVPEDNIVSEEEDFIEHDDEVDAESDVASENASIAEEVIVADIDDNPEQPIPSEQR